MKILVECANSRLMVSKTQRLAEMRLKGFKMVKKTQGQYLIWYLHFTRPWHYRIQGLSQLSDLMRQFVPSRPLEGHKREQLGNNFFYHYSKCNINDNMLFSTNKHLGEGLP